MGIVPEQGSAFIGKRKTFASAYPNVESAVVVYTETDFGDDPCKYVWNLAHDPRAACHNNLCYQGGYNFEWQLMQMVTQGTESSAVEMSCGGHEGTPKGRRRAGVA